MDPFKSAVCKLLPKAEAAQMLQTDICAGLVLIQQEISSHTDPLLKQGIDDRVK